MNCSKCGGKQTLLFTSWVCDTCDPVSKPETIASKQEEPGAKLWFQGPGINPELSPNITTFVAAKKTVATIPADSTYNFPIGTQIWFQQSTDDTSRIVLVPERDVKLLIPHNCLAQTRCSCALIYITKVHPNRWTVNGDLALEN